MKFMVAAGLAAVLLMVCSPIQGAKICVSRVDTCNDNVPVCGRFGGSNLCKNFKNRCEFEILNCASTTPYKIVNGAMCTGIPLNTRTFCNGLQTAPNVGGKFPHKGCGGGGGGGGCGCGGGKKKCGSNKFGSKGGHTGGVDVQQPIIINTGK